MQAGFEKEVGKPYPFFFALQVLFHVEIVTL